jgi:Tol biopolymer transport system component/predicted Ser/Thr protein kinase
MMRALMGLAAGGRLGPYAILGPLGAGGMGEVYRAHDAKLNRDVAIKVLPALVADDPERLMRFEREAQVLAALNHPHIAAVYGFEHHAIVMELVEGPTLAERIAQGHLPWSEALRIARQIADAFEAAHEKGIVHRDLKPANVKLTADGDVKVLDFGLAKAMDPTSTSGSVSNSPTLTARGTQMGVILGTAAYMSPEQARGKIVDRRADIWAFGCVLYEMVTGRRAFEGDEITDVLARLIERDPDWSALPANTPPEMRRLLTRCLTKDPKGRLRDIGEARHAIDEQLAGKAPATVTAPPPSAAGVSWSRILPWALTAILAAAVAVLTWRAPAPSLVGRPIRTDLKLPVDVEFFGGPSISADGMTFAFIGVRQGVRQIYTRSLDQDEFKAVAGTESATSVGISASGGSLAFVTTDLMLKRMSFRNGIVESVVGGATILSRPVWVRDESIVFGRGNRLVVRSATGDSERELAAADTKIGELSLEWPMVTENEAWVLFTARRNTPGGLKNRLEAVPLGGGARHLLLEDGEQVVFAGADRIVFKRGDALFSVAIDAARGEVQGTPTRLGEQVSVGSTGVVAAAVSRTGGFLAAPSSMQDGRLVWVSMAGVERPQAGPARGFQNPRVSPVGQSIAFSEAGTIWTFDPSRGTFTRVSKANEPNIGFSAWSVDASRIYFRSEEGIRVQRADGEGTPVVLPNTTVSDYPASFTPDGKTLVFLRISAETGGDIYTMPSEGGKATPLVATKAYEGGPQVSPDGKWLLYVSNEPGHMEIYLRPFGGGDRRWTVSGDGGLHPLWSRDGRRIFYRSGQRMMAVDLTTTPDVHLGTPQVLFDRRYEFGPNITFPNYSLSADGREFLMVQEEAGGQHFSLVLNWLQNLGR